MARSPMRIAGTASRAITTRRQLERGRDESVSIAFISPAFRSTIYLGYLIPCSSYLSISRPQQTRQCVSSPALPNECGNACRRRIESELLGSPCPFRVPNGEQARHWPAGDGQVSSRGGVGSPQYARLGGNPTGVPDRVVCDDDVVRSDGADRGDKCQVRTLWSVADRHQTRRCCLAGVTGVFGALASVRIEDHEVLRFNEASASECDGHCCCDLACS